MSNFLYADALAAASFVKMEPGSPSFASGAIKLGIGKNNFRNDLLIPTLKSARPFIISDEILQAFFAETGRFAAGRAERLELDIPFPTIFIEGTDQALFVAETESGKKFDFFGALIKELPNGYFFMFVTKSGGVPAFVVDCIGREHIESPDSDHRTHVGVMAHAALSRLLKFIREQKTSAGTERINSRIRTGSGDGRELVKIKELVHVCFDSEQKRYAAIGKTIDWSHRWEVMGHWRKIEGIGKNRFGEYVVKGLTWVTPHTKGPESKELVLKSRLVKSA